MKTTYTLSRDINGNKTLLIHAPGKRGFSIQTNGNLPDTDRNGVTTNTPAEVLTYVTDHGTDTQRQALGLPRRPRGAYYIQRRGDGQLETVDQFDTRKEARENLKEYQMADPTATHYISTRPCRDWVNK